MNKTLAIFSPHQNAYSETFIHAHKKLPFDIKYYYGEGFPIFLENSPDLLNFSFKERVIKYFNRDYNLYEHAMIKSLKSQNVSLVLTEYGPTACSTLKIIKALKLPLIVHFHGYDATNPDIIRKYKTEYISVFEYADFIVAVSEKMKRDITGLGCPADKIIVTPCGPNSLFLKNEPAFIGNQFISVSRFIDIKGPLQTISAFKKVATRFPEARMTMVGDGPLLQTCKYFVRSLRLSEKIFFPGVLSSERIAGIMNQSIAFLQHSFTLEGGVTEGTPVSVMEAQAAALPVIATRHAGIIDIVLENSTGFLNEELDIDAMAGSMIKIIENKEMAKEFGQRGKARILEFYSMDKHLQTLTDCIKSSFMS